MSWKHSSGGKLLSGHVQRKNLAWVSYPGKKQWQIVMVKCLEKADAPKGSTWKWPVKKDEHDYPICDAKQKIQLLPGG